MNFEWEMQNDHFIKDVTEKEKNRIIIPSSLEEPLSNSEKEYLKTIIARLLNPTYEDLQALIKDQLQIFGKWEDNFAANINWENQVHAQKLTRVLKGFTEQKFLKESYFSNSHNYNLKRILEDPLVIDKENLPIEITINELNKLHDLGYGIDLNSYIAKSDDNRWFTLNYFLNTPFIEDFSDKKMAVAWALYLFGSNDLKYIKNTSLEDYLKEKKSQLDGASLEDELDYSKIASDKISYIIEGKNITRQSR